MDANDLPSFSSATAVASSSGYALSTGQLHGYPPLAGVLLGGPLLAAGQGRVGVNLLDEFNAARRREDPFRMGRPKSQQDEFLEQIVQQLPPVKDPIMTVRIVRVFLLDLTEDLAVSDRILHQSEELVTDATDQELFYDIPVNEALAAHNIKRATVRDKAKSKTVDRDVMLEPVRVRDLKFHVAVVAQF